jgi:FkbM family methyltransferase
MKARLQNALHRLGYHLEGVRFTPRQLLRRELLRPLEFDDVVCRYMFEHGEACAFIQIGAFDGLANDPLRKYIERCGWQGVMLEPQPDAARKLRELYSGNDRVVVLEAALAGERGVRNLFTVDSDGLPAWTGQIASFDRDHLLRHERFVPGLSERVRELTVPCITFAEVLERLPSDRLDLLQIDAEGADGHLLSLFPFDRLKPAIVHWEIKNLTRIQQEAALDLLGRHGYLVARSGDEDMLAVAPDVSEDP